MSAHSQPNICFLRWGFSVNLVFIELRTYVIKAVLLLLPELMSVNRSCIINTTVEICWIIGNKVWSVIKLCFLQIKTLSKI